MELEQYRDAVLCDPAEQARFEKALADAPLSEMLDVCIQAATAAAAEIMDVYSRDFNVEMKSDNSPVTQADLRADRVIREMLTEAFPGCAVLTEESGADEGRFEKDYCFIVDPLDGTKEFVHRNGEFTVNIAMACRHRTVLGVILVPVTGELFYAAKGLGAFRNGDPIHVSGRTGAVTAMCSRSHGGATGEIYSRFPDRIARIETAGSSMKGCRIAEGKAELYYAPTPFTKEWDAAAQHAIVEEAGGLFLQGDGTPMLYNRDEPANLKGFIIANRSENLLPL